MQAGQRSQLHPHAGGRSVENQLDSRKAMLTARKGVKGTLGIASAMDTVKPSRLLSMKGARPNLQRGHQHCGGRLFSAV